MKINTNFLILILQIIIVSSNENNLNNNNELRLSLNNPEDVKLIKQYAPLVYEELNLANKRFKQIKTHSNLNTEEIKKPCKKSHKNTKNLKFNKADEKFSRKQEIKPESRKIHKRDLYDWFGIFNTERKYSQPQYYTGMSNNNYYRPNYQQYYQEYPSIYQNQYRRPSSVNKPIGSNGAGVGGKERYKQICNIVYKDGFLNPMGVPKCF